MKTSAEMSPIVAPRAAEAKNITRNRLKANASVSIEPIWETVGEDNSWAVVANTIATASELYAQELLVLLKMQTIQH